MFNIRGPWGRKKNLCLVCQVTRSSSQICKEVQKPSCGRDYCLFRMNAQNIFFLQLPKLNKYCLGVELAAAHQEIKKAQNGSSVGLHAVSHSMPRRLKNVIKKTKRSCQLLKFCIQVPDREINIYKFHVKIKFWSKVIVHEIRGTNFWDTLYIVKKKKLLMRCIRQPKLYLHDHTST